MTVFGPSPFAKPVPGLRIIQGAPAYPRPGKEDIERFPNDAVKLLDTTWSAQKSILDDNRYDLKWVEGVHFVLAGATGPGLGGALAAAVINLLGNAGSLTVVARDIIRSVGYHTGIEMQARAEKAGLGNRFHWINDGLALEGEGLEKVVSALKKSGARSVVYVNTVAAANSGLLSGFPPVFVKDVDEKGLFQWELQPLSEQNIFNTQFFMGEMAVQFTNVLEQNGFEVAVTAFADWRGSLDRASRDPAAIEYGRNGAYSTSLYLPKDIVQHATSESYNSGRIVLDFFLPIMRTRALGFIPGGSTMSHVYSKLMHMEGIRYIDVPELAVAMLERIGKSLDGADKNPFPRLDSHDAPLDLWFFEIVKQLNDNESSEFYYKRWIRSGPE